MSDMVLNADSAHRLMARLAEIQSLSTASYLMLCTTSGTQVAESGQFPGVDASIFCAMAAASWSSTGSMAQMIGEPGFRSVSHTGSTRLIHMVPVAPSALLVFLFSANEQLPRGFQSMATQWAESLQNDFAMLGGTSQVIPKRV